MYLTFKVKVGSEYFSEFNYCKKSKAKFGGNTQLGECLDYDGITGITTTKEGESTSSIGSVGIVKIIVNLMKYEIIKKDNIALEIVNE